MLSREDNIAFMSEEQEAVVDMQNTYSLNRENVIFQKISQKELAWNDFKESLQHWRIWIMLAYQDIKLRYRRSVLGPFWITVSMAITVYSMGYLYSHLFRVEFHDYFPYLVGGVLGWSLISTSILDLSEVFMLSENMIKQIKLPYSLYIHRVTTRNMIIFFHHLLVIIPVIIFFHEISKTNWYLLMLIPGLLIIYVNAICYGMVLAMIGTRYRDIPQIIKSFISVVFFVTPVIWDPALLPPDKQIFISLNPFYSFIELIRAPLTGHLLSLSHWIMVFIVTLVGILLSALIFSARRARIVYWI